MAQFHGNVLTGLVRMSTRHFRLVLTTAMVLTVALVLYAISHLSLDTDQNHLLDPNLPFRQAERQMAQAFPHNDYSVVIVVDGNSADNTDKAADKLARRFRQQTQLIASVYAPGEGDFFARNGLLYLDKSELLQLGDHLTEAAPFLGTLSQDASLRGLFTTMGRALDEKLSPENQAQLQKTIDAIAKVIQAQAEGKPQRLSWREQILSGMPSMGNDKRRFVLVQPRYDYTRLHPAEEALDAVRDIVAAEQASDNGVRMRLTGEEPIAQEELESVAKGATVATLLSFSAVCILLTVGFYSLRLVIATLLTLLVGLSWTAAFSAFAIGHMNLISVMFAVLFIGLGVDFGIQFTMRYREEFSRSGNHAQALEQTATGVGSALTLAASAAALGFFSFIPTDYLGLSELGIISGAGMFLALLANLTVLPALLTLFPTRGRTKPTTGGMLTPLNTLVQRHRRPILVIAALAGLIGLALVPQARFDPDPLNMKDPTTESVATFLELLRDPQTTPYSIEILAPDLKAAKALSARLEKLEVVDKVINPASFVPEDQQEKRDIIDDLTMVLQPLVTPAHNNSPTSSAEELQAYVKFREKLLASSAVQSDKALATSMTHLAGAMQRLQSTSSWPDQALKELRQDIVSDLPQQLARLRQLLKPGQVTLADLPPDLTERYIAKDGRVRIEVFPKHDMRNSAALRQFVAQVETVAPHANGSAVSLVEGGNTVVKACLQAAVLALLAEIVLLFAVMRKAVDVLLVLLPMLLAASLTVGISVLFNLPFNLANIIALPLLLAISIAFGIYMVARHRSETDTKLLLHTSTPRAVLFSALTTVSSFGTMAFSQHRGMSGMGLLLTLSLSFALIYALVVLPAIMAECEAK